jgi:acetyl-CoA carboxylase carboxyltransferase component
LGLRTAAGRAIDQEGTTMVDSSTTLQNVTPGKRQLSEDPRQQVLDARAVALAGSPDARRRLARLLDPESLVEYGLLAGRTSDVDDDAPSDGLVGGVGEIGGHPVVAASYDQAVRDGTQSDRNQRKLAKLIYLAITHRWPIVVFADGAGARRDDPLPPPPIVTRTRARWDVEDGLAELSGWAPSVAIVSGRALDGHASLAFLCDLVIGVAGSTIGGSAGAVVAERAIEDYAARGEVDMVLDDEAAAIAAARRYLEYWTAADRDGGEASRTHKEIGTIVPDNRRRPYDMRKLIAAFADEDSVLELGRGWAPSMVTSLARLGGRAIGIFANQPSSPRAGAIDSDAADKAARFAELCDAYALPLVSFVDNPGYMVGPDAEVEGIARHHARPLSAIHHRSVPLYTVQIRKAYGLGPYAMSGYGSSRLMPQLRLAWPSVESGGMSLEGAAYLVKRREIRSAASSLEARAIRDQYAEEMRDVASGVRAGRTYSFDDVVTPEETRGRILTMLRRTPRELPAVKKHPIDPR